MSKSMSIQMKGLDDLQEAIKGIADKSAVKDVVKRHTALLQQRAQQQTSIAYTGHYEGKRLVMPTGATKRSIGIQISDGGMTGTVGMGMEYDPYLEYGTRFMRARPVLKPTFAIESVAFINDLKDLVK